jgi:hypothetical protein
VARRALTVGAQPFFFRETIFFTTHTHTDQQEQRQLQPTPAKPRHVGTRHLPGTHRQIQMPKRAAATKAKVVEEPEPKRRSTRAAAPAPAPAPVAKAKAAKGKAAPAKAPAKAAPAKAAPAKKGKGAKAAEIDPVVFVAKVLETVKVLVAVCETATLEDPEEYQVITVDDFKTHGAALLECVPEEARMPLIEAAHRYQEEIEADPPFDAWEADDEEEGEEEEEGEDEGENDEEDAMEDELMIRLLGLFQFKEFFSKAEAAAFVSQVDDVIEATIDAWRESMIGEMEEEGEEEDEGEEEEEEEGDDDDDDDLYGDDDEQTRWKDED